jgi:hypothetical protein
MEFIQAPVNLYKELWSATVNEGGEQLKNVLLEKLKSVPLEFIESLNPLNGFFNATARQFGSDLTENVKGSIDTFAEGYSNASGTVVDKFWAGWRAEGSRASTEFAEGVGKTATSLVQTAEIFADKATVSKIEMFETKDAAAELAQSWANLTDDASKLPLFSGQVLSDIAEAELKVNGTSGISPALDASATSINKPAENTQAGSHNGVQAYDYVATNGKKTGQSVQDAGASFQQQAIEAGRGFASEVSKAMRGLTDAMRGFATEGTLRQAVDELRRLNQKLPQPVLT